MTVKYTIVARGDPRDPSAPKKYYPLAKSTGEVTLVPLEEATDHIRNLLQGR